MKFLLLLPFSLLLLFSACVPVAEKGSAACPAGSLFNSVTRSCYAALVLETPPVGTLSNVTMVEDTAKEIELLYSDINGDEAISCDVTEATFTESVACSCNGGRCFVELTPALNVYGNRAFSYTVTDDDGESAIKTVNVAIAAVDDAPLFNRTAGVLDFSTNDVNTPYIQEDLSATITLSYTDIDGGALPLCSATSDDPSYLVDPSNCICMGGSCTLSGVQSEENYFDLDPTLFINGSMTFYFSWNGVALEGSANNTIPVGVVAVNDAPTIDDDGVVAFSTLEDTVLNPLLLTATASDIEGDGITWQLVTAPTKGTLSGCLEIGAASGLSCTYTPDLDENGTDTFTFQACDTAPTCSDPIPVTITLTAVNDTPTLLITDASVMLAEDDPETKLSDITFGAGGGTDEDTEVLTITLTSSDPLLIADANLKVKCGTPTPTVKTTITEADTNCAIYGRPEENASGGPITITLEIEDPSGAVVTDTIDVTVTDVDDQPVIEMTSVDYNYDADEDAYVLEIAEGTPLVIKGITANEGGVGEEGQVLTMNVSSSNTTLIPNGSIRIYGSSSDELIDDADSTPAIDGMNYILLLITPQTGESGEATITMAVNDGTSNSDSIKLLIRVRPISVAHGGWKNIESLGARYSRAAGGTEVAAPFVKLEFNAFTPSGIGAYTSASVVGYNIYRREYNQYYDWDEPINTLPLDYSQLSYIDTDIDTGVTYYYTIRAIESVSNLEVLPQEAYSEIRVIVPDKNTAFIHRWMVNQEICERMHKPTDGTKNFQCSYGGPGSTAGFYDIGKDLIVDIAEAGCPYTRAEEDTDSDCGGAGCIGLGSPTATADNGEIYYDRTSAKCYIREVGAWVPFINSTPTAIIANKMNNMYLPPVVYTSQAKADDYCLARSNITYDGTTGAIPWTGLLSRKDQIAISSWSSNLLHADIESYEEGLSLSSFSKCNSSSASGLTYQDTAKPSSGFAYSLPASHSSGIRSMSTGSRTIDTAKGTENCLSRYGIQDLVGNVYELLSDYVSKGGSDLDMSAQSDYNTGIVSGFFLFDGAVGPFVDDDNDTNNDHTLASWTLADKSNESSYFIFPLGMPLTHTYMTTNAADPLVLAGDYLLIGTSSGIKSSELHGDSIDINEAAVWASTGGVMAAGGSYLTGTGAGRYHFKFISDSVDATGDVDVGFRCKMEVPAGSYTASPWHNYSY